MSHIVGMRCLALFMWPPNRPLACRTLFTWAMLAAPPYGLQAGAHAAGRLFWRSARNGTGVPRYRPPETARWCRGRALCNDPQGIRNRPELDAFVLAHVLAVDLEREGPARSQRQLGLIVECQDAAAARWPGRRQHLIDGADRAYRPQAAQREHVEAGVEGSLWAGVHRAAPQIRPGRRVGHDAEEQRADRRVPVTFQRERGMTPVGHPVVLPQDHPDIEGGCRGPAPGPVTVHGAHHLRVYAEARVEGEVPVAGQAKADRAITPCGDRPENLPGRVYGIGGQAYVAGEHIGVARGQRGQRRRAGRVGGRAAGSEMTSSGSAVGNGRRAEDTVDPLLNVDSIAPVAA